jgi:subtilisin family serine protease
MKRMYISRGKQKEIEEIEGVVAVKPKKGGAEASLSFGERAEPTAIGIAEREVGAFEKAGWAIVRPNPQLREAIEGGTSIEAAQTVQRVFRQQSGRTLLGTDKLTVRFKPTVTEEQVRSFLAAAGVEVVSKLKFASNFYEVRTKRGTDFLEASLSLSKKDDVVSAEPEFIEHIDQRFKPTDPTYGQQWHLNNTGQDGGTAGADIAAEAAWESTRGNGIRLAVVDNGFDVDHPDIGAAVDPLSGFFQEDASGTVTFVQDLSGYPDESHGTFCAGLSIARANNDEGGCGVANLANFMGVACLGDQVGTQVTLARAIAYSADPSTAIEGANPDDGADIISCSLGPNGADWEMTEALQLALDFAVTQGREGLGTPIFWAVTNGNFEIKFDEVCSYENVIGVGRSTRNDTEDDCGFGPELNFLATGVDVFSTDSAGGYDTSTGTSFAAPTAAGIGALVLGINPRLTWQQVRQIMRDTSDKISGVTYDANGHNLDYGHGRVNAARAVEAAAKTIQSSEQRH